MNPITPLPGSIRSPFERILAWILAWILLPVIFFAIEIAPKDTPAWVFALLGIAFFWLLKSRSNPFTSLSPRKFLLLIVGLFLILRLLWIFSVSTLPVSDFASYNVLAADIAKLKPLTGLDWRILNVPAWGYPVVLGLWYALVGNSLLMAKLLNILLGMAALLVFYKFSLYFGEENGRIATFFFAIWPAQVLYTGVLASEHLGMFTLLSAMLFINMAVYGSKKRIWLSALAGVFAGFTYITRSGLAYFVPAAVLYILLLSMSFKWKMAHIGLFVSAFFLTYGAYLVGMKTVYGVVPITNSLNTLLSGTNFESSGGWNKEDAQDFLSFNTVQESNAFVKQVAMRRIFNDPAQFLLLASRKVMRMWGDDQYGFLWSTMNLAVPTPIAKAIKPVVNTYLLAISQYFLVFILIFSFIGCLGIGLKRVSNPSNLWLLSLLLLAILFHTVFEAQPRYHFPFSPLFFLLAAQGLSGISFNFKPAQGFQSPPLSTPQEEPLEAPK